MSNTAPVIQETIILYTRWAAAPGCAWDRITPQQYMVATGLADVEPGEFEGFRFGTTVTALDRLWEAVA